MSQGDTSYINPCKVHMRFLGYMGSCILVSSMAFCSSYCSMRMLSDVRPYSLRRQVRKREMSSDKPESANNRLREQRSTRAALLPAVGPDASPLACISPPHPWRCCQKRHCRHHPATGDFFLCSGRWPPSHFNRQKRGAIVGQMAEARKKGHGFHRNPLQILVGMKGFEPSTP